MSENNATLSQEAIDALLNAQSNQESDEAPAGAEAPAEAEPAIAEETAEPADKIGDEDEEEPVAGLETTVAPAAREPVIVAAPVPPGATPPPGVIHTDQPVAPKGVDEQQAALIAGQAAESAVSPVSDRLSEVSIRVSALEVALKKIATLEAEIARLKAQKPAGNVTLEQLKPLAERMSKLEKAAKGSPVFNLYDKFTCASCASHGAAQVRARCGVCGKEGWFGRKEPDSKSA